MSIVNDLAKSQFAGTAISAMNILAATASGAAPYTATGNPFNTMTALANATSVITFPVATFAPSPTVQAGIIRFKADSIGTGGNITSVKFQASDGTTTVNIGAIGLLAANELPDRIIHFFTDLNATSIIVTVVVANVASGDLVFDVQIIGVS